MELRAGMFVYALSFMLGILIVQQFSVLPDISNAVLLVSLACVMLPALYLVGNHYKYKIYITLTIVSILLIILGLSYSIFYAKSELSKRLDELSTGRDMLVSGLVVGIPGVHGKVQSFVLDVDSLRFKDEVDSQITVDHDPGDSSRETDAGRSNFEIFNFEGFNSARQKNIAEMTKHPAVEQVPDFPGKIRLNWYYGKKVNAGERWQLMVRLKPPHGFMNPGGFDYEGWLFQHGVHATGYVRKSAFTQRLQATSDWRIDFWRQRISRQIDRLDGPRATGSGLVDSGADETVTGNTGPGNTGPGNTVPGESSKADIHHALEGTNNFSLLKALAVGDKSSITAKQWKVLSITGTSHLMAISGLHIGLASLFGYLLVRRLIPANLMKHVPAQHLALPAGFIVALCYALLAGFSIPTQRAIIMLFAITLMMLLRRQTRPVDTLGFALLLVLLVDPLAVMSAGFWFSFSAVAVIFISMTRSPNDKTGDRAGDSSWRRRLLTILRQWLRLQMIISIFMLPLSLYMFQQGSLVSPLANLILIPYVSFLVVPVVLMGIILSYLSVDLSQLLFTLALFLLDAIWPLLSYLSELPFAVWINGEVSLSDALLASLSLCLFYFSRRLSAAFIDRYGLPLKHRLYRPVLCGLWLFSLMLLLPLAVTSRPDFASGDFQLTVLDVGQGSSAVIRTKNHTAVFDAGAKFSDKLNVGSSVVIPYLRNQGIIRLDRLVISHGDADHIGGAQDLLDAYPETTLTGQDIELLETGVTSPDRVLCSEGLGWVWDGVTFVFLSPSESSLALFGHDRNNRSCVLKISSASGSVLLTGDIERDIERLLYENYGDRLVSDVLIVPHHGSNTSSSQSFISLVNPKISIISAGYKNRYRLPSVKVLKRYEQLNTKVLHTSDSGAVTLDFKAGNGGEVVFERYRPAAARYWNHNPGTE